MHRNNNNNRNGKKQTAEYQSSQYREYGGVNIRYNNYYNVENSYDESSQENNLQNQYQGEHHYPTGSFGNDIVNQHINIDNRQLNRKTNEKSWKAPKKNLQQNNSAHQANQGKYAGSQYSQKPRNQNSYGATAQAQRRNYGSEFTDKPAYGKQPKSYTQIKAQQKWQQKSYANKSPFGERSDKSATSTYSNNRPKFRYQAKQESQPQSKMGVKPYQRQVYEITSEGSAKRRHRKVVGKTDQQAQPQKELHQMSYVQQKELKTDNTLKQDVDPNNQSEALTTKFKVESPEISIQKMQKVGGQPQIKRSTYQIQQDGSPEFGQNSELDDTDDLLECTENVGNLNIQPTSMVFQSTPKNQPIALENNSFGKQNERDFENLDSANINTVMGKEKIEDFDEEGILPTEFGQKVDELGQLTPGEILSQNMKKLDDLDQELEDCQITRRNGNHSLQYYKSQDRNNTKTANEPYWSQSLQTMDDPQWTVPDVAADLTLENREQVLNLLKQKSKASSRGNKNCLTVETKKDQLEKIKLMKSPKPEKEISRVISKIEMMNLLDDAYEGIDSEEEDDTPYKPAATKTLHIARKETEMCKRPVLSASEGLTDFGESPTKLGDGLQKQKQEIAGADSQGPNSLNNLTKHRYDPHEPHSAQNIQSRAGERMVLPDKRRFQRQASSKQVDDFEAESGSISPNMETSRPVQLMNIAETDSECNKDRSDQKMFEGPDLDLLNAFDDNDSEDQFGLIQVQTVQKLELVEDHDLLDSNSLSLLHADDEQLDLMQPEKILPNDDENDLVDDGFFDNLVNGSGQFKTIMPDFQDKQQKNPEPEYVVNNLMQVNEQQAEMSPKEQQHQQSYEDVQYPCMNEVIAQNVQQSYFPEQQLKYHIFKQMLFKEAKQTRQVEKSIFEKQKELTSEMRCMLLDWICQVSSDYCLKRQTFHLTLQYIDAYLQRCNQHIQTQDFQLIGVTCLHMAAKYEEIYPPHIKSFAESTNDSVTINQIIGQEYKTCELLGWNFNQFQTHFEWAQWFMKRWDEYVDESLSYLKYQFQLKFFEADPKSHQQFLTFMQFVDIIAISYESREYCQRMVIACIMYLIIGGKDIMCAFQIEYSEMFNKFKEQFPIIDPHQSNSQQFQRLPEGILFYNQIIQPFFVREFGYYLHDLIEPLKFVLQFFVLDITHNDRQTEALMQQCKFTLFQYNQIAMEKTQQLAQNQDFLFDQEAKQQLEGFNLKQQHEFTEKDVYEHVTEYFSFQTHNQHMLDTLKFISQHQTNNENDYQEEASGNLNASEELALLNLEDNSQYQRSSYSGQPHVISMSNDASLL